MASEQIACTPAAINAAAASPEVVTKLELLVTDWCDQAELILHDDPSDQLKNADGEVMGPRTELEHWHDRMAVTLTLTLTRTRTLTLARPHGGDPNPNPNPEP